MRQALTCLHCLQVGNALEESLQVVQELPLLLQHIAAATTSRRDVPGGRVLIAGTAGYEGEAAVAAVAHLMHSAASSAHKALVQASQHHMALRVRAHVPRCSLRRRANTSVSSAAQLDCLASLAFRDATSTGAASPPSSITLE